MADNKKDYVVLVVLVRPDEARADTSEPSTPNKGPSKTNSSAYVDGWTRIFGKETRGQA